MAINTKSTGSIARRLEIVFIFLCFFAAAICLHAQQLLGAPLYFIDRLRFRQWQAYVKQSAGLLILWLNQYCAPATIQISADEGIRAEICVLPDGSVEHNFPARLVLMSNHQIYTDWVFLWWTAYTAGRHGDLFILLKESLQRIPVIGPGMMFFGFIFMSRKWENDLPRMRHRLGRLAESKKDDTPMWLLIFPEGTNMSPTASAVSKRWSKKLGTPPLEYSLVPRTRGLQFCLEELSSSVEYVYDATIAYDGIRPGRWGQEIYSMQKLWIDGHKAPLTHLHWSRFAVKDIPIHDTEAFDKWLNDRWIEKEHLLEHHAEHGCFPSSNGHIKVPAKVHRSVELLQILLGIPAAFVGVWLALLVVSQLKVLISSLRS